MLDKYETPSLEIVCFRENIVCASGLAPDPDEGDIVPGQF